MSEPLSAVEARVLADYWQTQAEKAREQSKQFTEKAAHWRGLAADYTQEEEQS